MKNNHEYELVCKYYAIMRDECGQPKTIPLTKEVYETLDGRDNKKLQNETERHWEYAEMTDEQINQKAVHTEKGIEELICEKELSDKLKQAIDSLSEVQRRRLLLYYKYELTYEQTAEMENCKYPAGIKSVKAALGKIKKYFIYEEK